MRKLWLGLILIAGCYSSAILLKNYRSFEGACAFVYANAVDNGTPGPNGLTKCLCGGTGRSGDGLGPCSCPDGCPGCKKNVGQAKTSTRKHLYFFSASFCRPCKTIKSTLVLLKSSGWIIVEQKLGVKTPSCHIILVDVEECKVTDVDTVPYFVLEENGKIIRKWIPNQNITASEIADLFKQ